MASKIFALVDCNNFFVSCERIFQPRLIGKPVVVLSNNDGCAIARSNEAKALGIKMGDPLFKFKDIASQHNVITLSSNFSLYRDISNRVMQVLSQMADSIEYYSVDEAFLDLSHLPVDALEENAQYIRETIAQWIGIPVSIGIATSKTLAKAAAYLAKSHPTGVVNFAGRNYDQALADIPVSQIWGVGKASLKLLERHHIYTALALKNMGVSWGRGCMSVNGGRLIEELNGNCAYEIGNSEDSRQSITVSRSFSTPTYQWPELKSAVAGFTEKACEKMRTYGLNASGIIVFIGSNRFQNDYYANAHLMHLPIASDYTPDFLIAANRALQFIYKPGVAYKKAGVTLVELSPKDKLQLSLLATSRTDRHDQVIKSIDEINKRYGNKAVSFGSITPQQSTLSKKESVSPRFTTSWDELMVV